MQNSYLAHHGIKGQKWGIRRYQNEDGSLTPAGKLHLGLNKDGDISLTREKANKQSIKKFVAKSLVSAGFLGAAIYISKHPEAFLKGSKYVKSNADKAVDDLFDEGPKVWSDKLGRYLTEEEWGQILHDRGLR